MQGAARQLPIVLPNSTGRGLGLCSHSLHVSSASAHHLLPLCSSCYFQCFVPYSELSCWGQLRKRSRSSVFCFTLEQLHKQPESGLFSAQRFIDNLYLSTVGMLPNCQTVTKPACFLRASFQIINACRNHALQIFCNKTGVKNILDVFEISALSCNLKNL